MSMGTSYLAVWRAGAGEQRWITGWSFDDFKTQDKSYFDEGLRLVDIDLHDGALTGVYSLSAASRRPAPG